MAVKARLQLFLEAVESAAGAAAGAAAKALRHFFTTDLEWLTGTSANQQDVVYSLDSSVASGTPLDIDVRGALTSKLDAASISFVEITGILVKHKSASGNLQIGAGSNPVASLWLAAGDGITLPPGGIALLACPTDPAWATVAGTGDILRLASSAGTINFELILLGRSA